MRSSRMSLLIVTLSAVGGCLVLQDIQKLQADIQDPPMQRHGPVRKLGRGIANMTSGLTEVYASMDQVSESDGSSAFASFGVVRGVARTLTRFGVGVYEVVTFPFPTTRGSYEPVLKLPTPWVHGGYEEFPPELGFETRFDYCRIQTGLTRMP